MALWDEMNGDEPFDVRHLGPFAECPRCGFDQAVTVVVVDPETLKIAAYALDVLCVACRAEYKLACPVDQIVCELPAND